LTSPTVVYLEKTPSDVVDALDTSYSSWEGEVTFDDDGYPLNPVGRTGLRGRLTNNRWGPIKAADAVVVCEGDVLVVRRWDSDLIALPAGRLDVGEDAREAAWRETYEETSLEFDFDPAQLIFRGMVDDNRSTDNAWLETSAYLLRVEGSEAAQRPRGQSDASEALWMPYADVMDEPAHASTHLILELALRHL
jgi:ADP-ribose pyrophosphatase